MKKILFVASEAVPFIKTGGLADVVGSLPKCFDKTYYDVRVMIPKYLCIKQEWRDKMNYVSHFYMDYMGQSRTVDLHIQRLKKKLNWDNEISAVYKVGYRLEGEH